METSTRPGIICATAVIVKSNGEVIQIYGKATLASMMAKYCGNDAVRLGINKSSLISAYGTLTRIGRDKNDIGMTVVEILDIPSTDFRQMRLEGTVLFTKENDRSSHGLTQKEADGLVWIAEYAKSHPETKSWDIVDSIPVSIFTALWG